MKRIVTGVIAAVLLLISGLPLEAARTNQWRLESIETWLEGNFKGTGLTSDGTLTPTVSTDRQALPARLVWEARTLGERQVVGTSFPSALYIIGDSEEPEQIQETNDLGFTALSKVDGTLYGAATPSGDIYRIDSDGQSAEKIATVPDSYVWTMKRNSNRSGLLVGTGSDGNLYHVSTTGSVTKKASLPASNIMSMTHYDGSLYLGTDGGGLYRLTEDDSVKSVYGFDEGEISSLAANDDYLYVTVNQRQQSQRQKKENQNITQLADQLRRIDLENGSSRSAAETSGSSSDPEAMRNPRSMMIQKIRRQNQNHSSGLFAGLSGSLVYRMDPPERMNVVYSDKEEIVHDLATSGDDLFVATSGSGRLYKVQSDFTRIAYFKADERLLLDVQTAPDGSLKTIATGEGGSLHRTKPFEPGEVTYRSSLLDAQILASWGQLETVGNEQYEIRTRSGNTTDPDTGWTDWSTWRGPSTFEIPSEPARFLQLEARFLERTAKLRKLNVAFQIPNQRPRIAKLSISPNPVSSRFVNTQEATNGDQSNRQRNQGRQGDDQQIESHQIKQRTVSWKVIDPDGDPARSKLYYRPLDGEQWISFTGENYINQQQYNIDLRNLSDGRYRLKLVTTDSFFNDPDHGFTVSKKTAPLLVDNTQPQFDGLTVSERRARFTARDETSRIMLAQYRTNGGHWQTIWPDDNIFDERIEKFSLEFPDELDSGDLVEFRLLDEGGNQALSKRTIP
jgi:sugar lactone lactonase YvrE